MAIKIAHCPGHVGTKTVVAAGADISATTHTHGDGSDHTCMIINVDSETQPATYPHTTADGSTISDPDAWLDYLKKYI